MHQRKETKSVIGIVADYYANSESLISLLCSQYGYIKVKCEGESDIKKAVNDMKNLKIILDCNLSAKIVSYLESKASFRLVYISSPVKLRFSNYKANNPSKTIEDFFSEDKQASTSDFLIMRQKAKNEMHIDNDDIQAITTKVKELISFLENFRPNWNDYFMSVAHEVAQRCNCVKSKVGAVIVKNNRIISVGYNGTPSKIQNCYDGHCERCWSEIESGKDLDKCICIHAEENALLEAGRQKCEGGKIYCTLYPCLTCAKHIIQSGISEVVYDVDYNSELTKALFLKANINVTKWSVSKTKII